MLSFSSARPNLHLIIDIVRHVLQLSLSPDVGKIETQLCSQVLLLPLDPSTYLRVERFVVRLYMLVDNWIVCSSCIYSCYIHHVSVDLLLHSAVILFHVCFISYQDRSGFSNMGSRSLGPRKQYNSTTRHSGK